MTVQVPATSANLGPGFDALGLALSLRAELGLVGTDPPVERAVAADEFHPATVAFRRAGGHGDLWVRSPIPMGRGLGYSGAMRVGGAALAVAHERGHLDDVARRRVFHIAAVLEGHADNAGASVYGGLVATDGTTAITVTLGVEPDVVVWVPPATTSTDSSRATLPTAVALDDAAANIGRTALLIAALAAGDIAALRDATDDRLHQPHRLAAVPGSAAALSAGLDAGAWCGWLSGSGPTVAFLTDAGRGGALAAVLPSGGTAKVLHIDHDGVCLAAP